jgi:hypothetical protein
MGPGAQHNCGFATALTFSGATSELCPRSAVPYHVQLNKASLAALSRRA